MTTTEQDNLLIEAMHLWPRLHAFPTFEKDLTSWWAKVPSSQWGNGITLMEALLHAAECYQSGSDEKHLWQPVIDYLKTIENEQRNQS